MEVSLFEVNELIAHNNSLHGNGRLDHVSHHQKRIQQIPYLALTQISLFLGFSIHVLVLVLHLIFSFSHSFFSHNTSQHRSRQVKAGQSRSRRVTASQGGSQQVKAGQSRSKQVKAGYSRSQQVKASQNKLQQVTTSHNKSMEVSTGHSKSRWVTAGDSDSHNTNARRTGKNQFSDILFFA